MADFLRISPWQADGVRTGLRAKQINWLLAEGERNKVRRCLYLNLDDSRGAKDKATTHLEPVEWH